MALVKNTEESEVLVSKSIAEKEIENNNKPAIVFKYKALTSIKDITRVCDILKDNKIYMPNYLELNDPLEGVNAKLAGESPLRREAIRREYRILSFSRNGFLPPMWAHYAGNYNGLCLAFRTNDTFSNIKEVQYKSGQVSFTSDLDLSMPEDILIKSKYWEPEEEWRFIKNEADFRIENNGQRSFFQSFQKDDLACVLIGYNTPYVIRSVIIQAVPNRVSVFEVRPDDNSFCLCARDITNKENYYTSEDLLSIL